MDELEVKQIRDSCVKYELMPRYRKTKQEQNAHTKLGSMLKTTQSAHVMTVLNLCLALIKDKTTLDPKLTSDYSDFFIKVINSPNYAGKTISEIVEIEVNLRQSEQALRKIRDEEIYELQEGWERKKSEWGKVFEENEQLKMQLAESERTRTHYFNELQKYDSDNSSEEEIDYEKIEITEIVVNEKIDELIDFDYDNDQTEEEVRIAQQKRLEQLAPPPVTENKEGAAEAAAAKAYFESLEQVNKQKRVANRLKYETPK
jgi:hypothetical protein